MQKNMQKIISSVNESQGMPDYIKQLFGVLNDPEVSISKIEEALDHNPGLATNIIKLMNSPYFGLASKTASISQAVALVGLNRVVQIIMTSCVNALMTNKIDGYNLPDGELWRHSIAVSVAVELLVNELKLKAPEEIFIAALLHDIGKLALGNFVADEIEGINNQIKHGKSFHEAEKEVIGTDHAEVGSTILKMWSLPENIINAVRWHHNPDFADNSNMLVDLVHIADGLCLMIGIGVGREGLRYEPSKGATERLEIRHSHLEVVASQTLQISSELSNVFCSN